MNRDNYSLDNIVNKKISKESINNLSEIEVHSLLDLIDQFKISTNNNLGDILLSFHTGKWVNVLFINLKFNINFQQKKT